MRRLWIDDVRPAPDGWEWAKNSEEAISLIDESMKTKNYFDMASFDHDLGWDDTTIRVANMIEKFAYDNKLPRIIWAVHSANPVGTKNLKMILERADMYWDRNEEKLG
jgi:hypothetical protein